MPLVSMLYGCLAEFAVALFGLILFMRWRERGLMARLGSRLEKLHGPVRDEVGLLHSEIARLREVPAPREAAKSEAKIEARSEAEVKPAAPAPPSPDLLSAVVDLHRRGEAAPWIAAALGIRPADVKMMIMVHDRMSR